jgi:hypothetical protein
VSDVVFRAEREAGLEAAIRSSNTATAVAIVRPAGRVAVPSRTLAELRAPMWAKAGATDDDLFYLESILVSTGFNSNGDYFCPVELATAQSTPVFKPININHSDKRIVGSLISAKLVDADLKPVNDETPVDEFPPLMHLQVGGVIWRCWASEQIQKQVDELLAAIEAGDMRCSMEVSFPAWDYAVEGKDGAVRIVARSSQTADMTRALQAFGGSGEYGGERIGRALRAMVFSGEGLVTNPANRHSVILKPPVEQAVAKWFEDRYITYAATAKPTSKVAADVLAYLGG